MRGVPGKANASLRWNTPHPSPSATPSPTRGEGRTLSLSLKIRSNTQWLRPDLPPRLDASPNSAAQSPMQAKGGQSSAGGYTHDGRDQALLGPVRTCFCPECRQRLRHPCPCRGTYHHLAGGHGRRDDHRPRDGAARTRHRRRHQFLPAAQPCPVAKRQAGPVPRLLHRSRLGAPAPRPAIVSAAVCAGRDHARTLAAPGRRQSARPFERQ